MVTVVAVEESAVGAVTVVTICCTGRLLHCSMKRWMFEFAEEGEEERCPNGGGGEVGS